MSDHTSSGIFGDIMDALAKRMKRTRNGGARKAIKAIASEVLHAFSNADFCPEDSAPDSLVLFGLAEQCDKCEGVFMSGSHDEDDCAGAP